MNIIQQGNKNYALDLTSKRITFLDSRFYFDETGSPVPSVTTILNAFPKTAEFYQWLKKNGENADEIRDEAGRKGSRVHALTEAYDNGDEVSLLNENGDLAMSTSEWAMLEKYVEFRTRFPFEINSIEQNMVALGMGGTLDRDITLDGKRYILDIKTSSNIWDEYWLQLAAYQKMKASLLGGDPYDGRAIIWLNAKTRTEGKKGAIQGIGWQLLIKEDDLEEDWKVFQATKMLWHKINENLTPRKIEYQLSHQISK